MRIFSDRNSEGTFLMKKIQENYIFWYNKVNIIYKKYVSYFHLRGSINAIGEVQRRKIVFRVSASLRFWIRTPVYTNSCIYVREIQNQDHITIYNNTRMNLSFCWIHNQKLPKFAHITFLKNWFYWTICSNSRTKYSTLYTFFYKKIHKILSESIDKVLMGSELIELFSR